ncbi:NADH-ubiquinone oxidoreductase-F iron-sulfur binding region domain-containing protein [Blastococcus saxobsidens]|uniref:NADH-quinone oxidoreductase subunit F n=1 Tax=Blastococcus saxobsidens (strain DD2) TaxID=1146883 RepID=H6RQJ9_BLASD|nr:NADH-ubiquinone oxidoreductase-F iron-sulfur binding region domain-containing protein [Blastococcus saxobsidens]CCG05367.1 NADH-quinone oxidoreductase subunit F [Blastococcus saxobsidens DD2]
MPDVLPWSPLGAGLLLAPGPEAETLPDFRQEYPEVAPPDSAALVDVLRRADLRGRGGAGFPAWRKIEAVVSRRPDGPVAVVANGEEGEPASCKDRYLLRHRPHLVLEGLEIVRRALVADAAYVYVSDELGRDRVLAAIAERGLLGIEVFLAPRGYVSGEESAVVRALDGGPALPTQKPPRPFESGVGQRPTAVMNVETLARACRLWTAAALDQDPPVDLLMLTLLDPDQVVLTEVPAGTTLREVARQALGLDVSPGTPVLSGGFFSGFLPDVALDAPLDFDGFRRLGTGVGCGSFIFLPGACPVDVATDVMAFFDRENAHQCGSCFKGTAAMHQALERIGLGTQQDTDVANLERWTRTLPGRGSCATLDGAACLARTLLTQFAGVVERHATVPCAQCAAAAERADPDTRFRVPAP